MSIWAKLRERATALANERREWCGYPMPIEHAELVVERTHPLRKTLSGARLSDAPLPRRDLWSAAAGEGLPIINSWHDALRGVLVIVYRDDNGKPRGIRIPDNTPWERFTRTLDTLAPVGIAYDIRQEATAQLRLKELLTDHAWSCYFLTGMFLESSPRSRVTYLFRRGRPTVAMMVRHDRVSPVCALCLHPIGHYANTWCGVMTPTDDVIAHLCLMRGDEPRFWRKANHHPVWAIQAGI